MAARYPIVDTFQQACQMAGLDARRLTRRAGLPEDWAEVQGGDVTAVQFFGLWQAFCDEVTDTDAELHLAKGFAHGPFSPPIFAFSCAETLGLGLRRLADFKPLLGPMRMDLSQTDTEFALRIESVSPGLQVPVSLERFELAYILECARCFTGEPIQPLALAMANPVDVSDALLNHLGCVPTRGAATQIVFRRVDADRPLITRSQALWDSVEPMLSRQLRERGAALPMADRVRGLLPECLPGGATRAEDVARRLNTSKRSLQRRLTEEGTSFQALLAEVRSDLARRYLTESEVSVPEVSHLLGFRDTSSFFRAFQSWTGETPNAMRLRDRRA